MNPLDRFKRLIGMSTPATPSATAEEVAPPAITNPVTGPFDNGTGPDTLQEATMADQNKPDPTIDPAKNTALPVPPSSTPAAAAGPGSESRATQQPATFAELDGAIAADVPGRDTLITACLRDGCTLAAAFGKVQAHLISHANAATSKATELGKVAGAAGGGIAPIRTATGPNDGSMTSGGMGSTNFRETRKAKGPGHRAFWEKVETVSTERKLDEASAIKFVQSNHRDLLDGMHAESVTKQR